MAYTKATKDGLVSLSSNKRPLQKEELPTFNLSDLNYTQLYRDLQNTFNKGKPVFFKSLGVRRARLDVEHQEWVLRQIRNLREINSELVNLKAETFLNQQVLDSLIDGYPERARRETELALETHITAVYELKMRRKMLDLEKRDKKADTALKEEKAELIKFIRTNTTADDLSPDHKTLLMQAMVNPQGNLYQDIEILRAIKEHTITEAEAKARFSTATARMKEADAKTAEKTAEQTENDFNEIRNSSKTK